MRSSSKWSSDCLSVKQGIETTGDMNWCCCCCSAAIFLPLGVPVASLQRRGNGGGGGESTLEICDDVVDTSWSVCWEHEDDEEEAVAVFLPRK